MYYKPPFNPGEKLAQINANIKFPANSTSKQYSEELIKLLLSML
jgi:hypothetical protein